MRMNCVLSAVLFALGSFAGQPGKRDYLENFQPGSQHLNTWIPANRAGLVVE